MDAKKPRGMTIQSKQINPKILKTGITKNDMIWTDWNCYNIDQWQGKIVEYGDQNQIAESNTWGPQSIYQSDGL